MPCWLRLRVNRTRRWDRRSIASSMLVCCSGRVCAPHASYLFKHALVQDAAYGTMLREPRRALHARIAETLESRFPEIAPAAGGAGASLHRGRPRRAGDRLLAECRPARDARSAHIEAERHLRRGLELLIRLPETTAAFSRDCPTKHARRLPHAARGFGSPEVAAAFNRAAEVCTRINDDRGLFIALRGNGQYHMISGDMRTACDDARRILALAEAVGNHDFLIEAHHLGWSALCFAGEFRAATARPRRASLSTSANATIT